MSKSKVTKISDALVKVREVYPNATMQGSTFDWSFWLEDKLVAIAITNRRTKKDEWSVTIFDEPQEVF